MMMKWIKKKFLQIVNFYVSAFKYIANLIGAAAISGAIMIPLVFATQAVTDYLGFSVPDITKSLIPADPTWQILAGMFLIVGILEENIYRYFLQDCILGRMMKFKLMPAVIIASLIFGLAHFSNAVVLGIPPMAILPQVVGAAGVGLWFGYLYNRRGLHFVILTHALYDFLVSVPILLS